MSLVGNALNKWLQRQNMSILRQEATVCDRLPEHTRVAMIDISEESAMWRGIFAPWKLREKGAPITEDYTLGGVRTGTMDWVAIPRPEGTIGTFHTHPFGTPFPSPRDTFEAVKHSDRVMCIGATGKAGTKVQCFTPIDPKWSEIQFKFRLLVDDIKDYNDKLSIRYKRRGWSLQRLLESVGSAVYLERVEYVTPEELKSEATAAEMAAKGAEEDIKVANARINETNEAVNVAHIELSKATTDEERREAEAIVRIKEEEARRAVVRVRISQELARDARATADETAFKAAKLVLGRAQAVSASKDAAEQLREGSDLARRRDILDDDVKLHLSNLAAPEEWKAPKWVNGFEEAPYSEVYPSIFSKCRIIWETFKGEEGELPYEL